MAGLAYRQGAHPPPSRRGTALTGPVPMRSRKAALRQRRTAGWPGVARLAGTPSFAQERMRSTTTCLCVRSRSPSISSSQSRRRCFSSSAWWLPEARLSDSSPTRSRRRRREVRCRASRRRLSSRRARSGTPTVWGRRSSRRRPGRLRRPEPRRLPNPSRAGPRRRASPPRRGATTANRVRGRTAGFLP